MIIWKMLEQFAAFFIWYFAAPQPTMRHSREIQSLTLRFNDAFFDPQLTGSLVTKQPPNSNRCA